ncbi:MAG: glycosyl hydrolase [Bacteroidetes bacterium]|nr:glycosyl hydrolase [Bacteroidota bacterium]
MKRVLYFLSFILLVSTLFAQSDKSKLTEETFSGLKFRNIGPAFMSGRISDIAIHPESNNIWYVAVGSGGVWKTTNAGTTWQPIFDKQTSFSIGCITIDENNPHTLWVGTGENISGRHVAYGDGIYRSDDDGANWTNMGLKDSEHISKIIVHPENSDIVWVASQGPLWRQGGERGVYKTIDGGKTWEQVLGDDKWIGATDLLIDPRDPKVLYAATWQRTRNVAAVIDGGPGTALYRSEDGGDNWERLTKGLPENNMGKIGLAISPQKPDVVYAVIELERRTGGFYKSTNRGASWEKQSDEVSGGTGPHYYQELYACPHNFDRVYLANSWMKVTDDGGKTFRYVNEKYKHPDNHAWAFRKDDPNYMMAGTDGGLYETFDNAKTWRHIKNLPVTQFYKIALDDAEPFYNIIGGTQDNNTQLGPSRTDNVHGITNRDWIVTLFGDGHQPATEPGNPDIMYCEWQEGGINRLDRITGELIDIRPRGEEDDPVDRFNWDAPILVSPHNPTRLYYASQRVWRSEDRGDSWTPISGDLTKNQNRLTFPIMGKKQSWDESWDYYAMSQYNTITSLAESPVQEGLIYAGTDDGFIQVTEDSGKFWRAINVGDLPDVPNTAFVNDIKADLFDVNTVYVALDNHKFGDLNPYLLKSSDKGRTWKSIKSNLPERTLVWRLVQDHVKKELLFAATEFGIYFTLDGGGKWTKLTGDVPTISFRDLAIQKRENDLVGASFGRGIFVLDDYSLLREVSDEQLKREATLFPTRKAWWYIQQPDVGFGAESSQGSSFFQAPNPAFGAVFSYYLADGYKTLKSSRQEKEKELRKSDKDIEFPGWDAVEAERRQDELLVWLTVRDKEGLVVRKIKASAEKGFHRVAWDLRYPSMEVVGEKKEENDYVPAGYLVLPGTYSVSLSKQIDGVVTELSEWMEFEVVPLREGALEGPGKIALVEFLKKIEELNKEVSAVSKKLTAALKQVKAIEEALAATPEVPGELNAKLHEMKQFLYDLEGEFKGHQSKSALGVVRKPGITSRLGSVQSAMANTTYGPTPNLEKEFKITLKLFADFKDRFYELVKTKIPNFVNELSNIGAPLVEGIE